MPLNRFLSIRLFDVTLRLVRRPFEFDRSLISGDGRGEEFFENGVCRSGRAPSPRRLRVYCIRIRAIFQKMFGIAHMERPLWELTVDGTVRTSVGGYCLNPLVQGLTFTRPSPDVSSGVAGAAILACADTEVGHEIHPPMWGPNATIVPTSMFGVNRWCRPMSTKCVLVSASLPWVITLKYSTCVNQRSERRSGILEHRRRGPKPVAPPRPCRYLTAERHRIPNHWESSSQGSSRCRTCVTVWGPPVGV